ncbi:WD40 repeat-like protein [Gyrodon lividus]|nr:WD40 repeat-like protein [Gyrodon lividus]
MTSRLYDTARNAYWRVRGLPTPPLVLLGHTRSITSVAFLPDGKQVISGSEDSSVRAWRVEDGREVATVISKRGSVLAVAVSGDGRWIATGGSGKTIMIWNAITQETVVELEGHLDRVLSLAFSPDSGKIVSGSDDGTVIVWDTTTSERLAGPLKGHANWVDSVSFSPNGDQIASCDYCDIRIWNSHSGELVISPIQVDSALSLAWTPNGQQLVAGSVLGSIKEFDTSTGSLLAEWNGHDSIVYSIAVSPNGKFIASGSRDATVRLWDTTTRRQICPALHHDSHVLSVAISPDSSHLVSGGRDQQTRIWSLQGITPPSVIVNTPVTCDDTPLDIYQANFDSKQVSYPPPQEAQGSPSLKDKSTAEKEDSDTLDATLERRLSRSSSPRNFLDRPAVVPVGAADDTSDPMYGSFFEDDLSDTPLPVDEPPKKRFAKLRNKFTRKRKDRGVETQPQPDRQQVVTGAEAERPIYPRPAMTSPRELTPKDEGEQKGSDPTLAGDADGASTPKPQLAAYTKHQVRNRFDRIRQAIMRRRDGSTAQARDCVEVTPVAYGKLTERMVRKPYLRKRWKGKLKSEQPEVQANSQAGLSTVATTSPQQDHDSDSSHSNDTVVPTNEDVEASLWRVLFYLLCYRSRDPYIND